MLHLTDPSQLLEPSPEEHQRALNHLKLDVVRDELFRLDSVIDIVAMSGKATPKEAFDLIEVYRSLDAAWVFLSRELGTLN